MEGTALRIAAVLALSVGVACATSPEISLDQREDFSRYRTWDWLTGAARTIDAPSGDTAELDRDLARLVETELEKRGFRRIRRAPDLRIGVRLDVRREEVTVHETGAIQQLSSLHFSPSYQVQSTSRRRQIYERLELVVFAIDARRGRVVWQGELAERFRHRFSPHLDRTIASLLGRFPPAGRTATDSHPPAREPATRRPSELAGPPVRSFADTAWVELRAKRGAPPRRK